VVTEAWKVNVGFFTESEIGRVARA